MQLLQSGNVLRTHPWPDYWGCAVVLTSREAEGRFDPMCHIAVTPAVFRHPFVFTELSSADLSVLEIQREQRVAELTYVPRPPELCIGVYSRRGAKSVEIIGNVSPATVYAAPLVFDTGVASGGWPLCGPVSVGFGSEAVVAWRRVHDAEAFARDVTVARARTEALLAPKARRRK